jgi:hypothetical protein
LSHRLRGSVLIADQAVCHPASRSSQTFTHAEGRSP